MTGHTDPTAALTLVLPNFDQLRAAGWSVKTMTGTYCVAWRNADEVVFAWRDGEWQQVTTRSLRHAA